MRADVFGSFSVNDDNTSIFVGFQIICLSLSLANKKCETCFVTLSHFCLVIISKNLDDTQEQVDEIKYQIN